MVFTDVIFADGAFHTLKTVINEKPSALPRDSVQFDDNPVINLVGLICGRLAGGNGRLVAVGCRRDLDVLLVNDEGRQRILGAGYGSWPVAIRYREGVFEVFVVKDPLVWIKYRFDADLNETDDPVLLDVPPDAPPHVGILDLIEDQDEAIWSRSEIDLTYLRSDDGIGNAKLAGWMTRGAWTVGLSTLGQPVAVNMGDGRAYLLAGPVTTGMPPRVAVDDDGTPMFALTLEQHDVAPFGLEAVKERPIALEPVEPAVPAGPVEERINRDTQYVPEQPARGGAVGPAPVPSPPREQSQLEALLHNIVNQLGTIHGQINILTEALQISLRTIDNRLIDIERTADQSWATGLVLREKLERGFTFRFLGRDFAVLPKPYATDTRRANTSPRPDHARSQAVDRDRDRRDPSAG